MKLKPIPKDIKQYQCKLTTELDSLAGLEKQGHDYPFYHYILADEFCLSHRCLAIRVPGGTVGGIWIDEHNKVTRIEIDTTYVIKTYPDNVNECVQKYVGELLDLQN